LKNKFISIISPLSVIIALTLDTAVVYYGVYAVQNIGKNASALNIVFLIIDICSIFLAVFYTREVLRHGIRFKEDSFELTFLDENNAFEYANIESVEVFKDTKASFKKNFVDRYSRITLNLKDGNSATLELGLTTKRKLKKIESEINSRIEA